MRRFAGQRLLAERPQEVITDDIVDALEALVEKGEERAKRENFKRLAIPVGPKLKDSTGRPMQMKMEMAHTPIHAPFFAEGYRKDGIGIVTGDGGVWDSLNDTPLVREIAFGWDDPKKRYGMSFEKPNDSVIRRQLAVLNMQSLLKDAQLKLTDRAGMSSGDLLSNYPVGLSDGDFRRAKT